MIYLLTIEGTSMVFTSEIVARNFVRQYYKPGTNHIIETKDFYNLEGK